jgi:Na+-translocating ferredoxin:NAD+ oxidoreductase RnfD subunit
MTAPEKPPTPAASPDRTVAVALRFAASGLLLALYFVFYGTIIEFLATALQAVIRLEPSSPAPRVVAVTVLGISLVAIWWKLIEKDVRFHAPILITYILVIGDVMYGVLESHTSEWLTHLTGGRVTTYSPTFVAIVATVAMDMLLARFMRGKWPHLSSAYITGISVGILIKSPELWPFVLCGLISIASKYVLRVRGRHLWNPSNFGVTAMLLLAAESVASLSVQAGNDVWPVLLIWALGSLILYRLGRLHIPLVFLATFIPLAFVRSSISGRTWITELGPVTWPMFQLYIFFMITDPPTTTKKKWSQCLVAALVAVMDTILRVAFGDIHALYHALFIVGPISNLVEIYATSPKSKENQAAPVMATPASPECAKVEAVPAHVADGSRQAALP